MTSRVRFVGVTVLAVVLVSLMSTACGPPPGPDANGRTPVAALGTTGPQPMSADGRFVTYLRWVPSTRVADVYVWDRSTGLETKVTDNHRTDGSGFSQPAISADGSTIVFRVSSGGYEVIPGRPTIGREFFRYSLATGALEQIDLPAPVGFTDHVNSATVSGDGSQVVVGTDNRITRWSSATGFTDVAVGDSDESVGSHAGSISPNGRYVAVLRITSLGGAPERQAAAIEVYDVRTNSIASVWEGGAPRALETWGVNPWDFSQIFVTDDGSARFTYNSGRGVLSLDGAIGNTGQIAGYGGVVATASSPNGRFIGYTGPRNLIEALNNVSEVTNVTTGEVIRLSGAAHPGKTTTRAISDSGRYVLVYIDDATIVAQSGLYLIDRGR